MTIKQIVNDLLNKKWSLEDLFWLIFMCVIFSTVTTPFFGIPIGVIAYFLFFIKMMILMRWEKNMIIKIKIKNRTCIYTDKNYLSFKAPTINGFKPSAILFIPINNSPKVKIPVPIISVMKLAK